MSDLFIDEQIHLEVCLDLRTSILRLLEETSLDDEDLRVVDQILADASPIELELYLSRSRQAIERLREDLLGLAVPSGLGGILDALGVVPSSPFSLPSREALQELRSKGLTHDCTVDDWACCSSEDQRQDAAVQLLVRQAELERIERISAEQDAER